MLSIGDPTKKQNAKKHVLHVCSPVSQKNEEKTKKRAEISKHVLAMNVGQDRVQQILHAANEIEKNAVEK